jgi:hypothetical protein
MPVQGIGIRDMAKIESVSIRKALSVLVIPIICLYFKAAITTILREKIWHWNRRLWL